MILKINLKNLKITVQKYNNYKILITGASGQLGTALHIKTTNIFNVLSTSNIFNKDYQKLDITSSHNVKMLFDSYNPDIIINCAAYTNVDDAETFRNKCHSVNVEGLRNLIRYSHIDTKIINISSDYIFDGIYGNYTEDSLPNPENYYGKCKHEADNILMSSNRKYLIFRVNGIYSNLETNNFYNWVLKSLNKKKSISVSNDLISNPTYVFDLVNVIIDSIIMGIEGLYNYGSNTILSKFEFANKIAEIYSLNKGYIKPIEVSELNLKAKRPLKTNLICDKIVNMLDIELSSINQIIKRIKNE